jgi:hypothetical protein
MTGQQPPTRSQGRRLAAAALLILAVPAVAAAEIKILALTDSASFTRGLPRIATVFCGMVYLAIGLITATYPRLR